MRLLPFAVAAALCVSAPAFADGLDVCDFESDFDLRITPDALLFHRDAGAPASVEMRSGRLYVDGSEIALGRADRERVQRYEDTVRELVPEVKGIALDAIGVASEAVIEVAAAFSGDRSDAAVARLREVGAEVRAKIERSDDSGDWREAEVEQMVASLTSELVPMVIGDVTAFAVKAALSGDDAGVKEIEARVQRMERELNQRVEARADALKARADALCPRVAELEALQRAFELRIADNQPLVLLRPE